MVVFAWILLLASSTRVQLVDEVYQIPAKEWRFVELGLNQKPAKVWATYQVESGPREVRLALMRREDLGTAAGRRPGKRSGCHRRRGSQGRWDREFAALENT